jgi:putative transposase
MVTRPRSFDTYLYYHIYNRGVEKRKIFQTVRDYQRFVSNLHYYLHNQKIPFTKFERLSDKDKAVYFKMNPEIPETRRVHLIAYCLMPNHFHLLLKGEQFDGITTFVSDISNSHTRYFNIKYERVGRLFQGTFKSKEIAGEESLLQVSRYIHLNPIVSELAKRPENYPYSSYKNWIGQDGFSWLSKDLINTWIEKVKGPGGYKKFVESKIGETVKDSKRGIENLVLE